MIGLSLSDQTRWTCFSDQVMGGVSVGGVRFEADAGLPVMHLTGTVSTANRGGFLQVRTMLDTSLPATAQGVLIDARGNDQRYFIHLRTRGTMLPWQYYQASFDVTTVWHQARIPFDVFAPSGRLLRNTPDPAAIRSLGIVAFGRDHVADLSVRAVGFY